MLLRREMRSARWIATMAIMATAGSGCAKCQHYLHGHTPLQALGQIHVSYFHCPDCGQVVNKADHHHCRGPHVPPPFYGYKATCWNTWPGGWSTCPPPGLAPSPNALGLLEMPPQPLAQPAPTVPSPDVTLQAAQPDASETVPAPALPAHAPPPSPVPSEVQPSLNPKVETPPAETPEDASASDSLGANAKPNPVPVPLAPQRPATPPGSRRSRTSWRR